MSREPASASTDSEILDQPDAHVVTEKHHRELQGMHGALRAIIERPACDRRSRSGAAQLTSCIRKSSDYFSGGLRFDVRLIII